MTATSNIPFAAYQKLMEVNISSLLAMDVSAKQYAHDLVAEREDRAAFRVGRAAHTLLLEPQRFASEYAVSPYPNFLSGAAKSWRADQELAELTVLTEAEHAVAIAMATAVTHHRRASQYLSGGSPEVTLRWQDARSGLMCKGRVDYLGEYLADLKTSRHVVPRQFRSQAAQLHYHVKLAWYQDATEVVTGRRVPVRLISVQTDPPHDVVVYRVEDDVLDVGRAKYRELLDRLQHCRATGTWPGVAGDEELKLTLPAWATASSDDEEPITMGGVLLAF